MRIVTWNCQSGFQSKTAAFLRLDADIAVVPECTEEASKVFPHDRYQSLWFGSPKQKGLAIFYRPEWRIRPIRMDRQHKWIVPLQVTGPESFTLVAVWMVEDGTFGFTEKIRAAFAENIAWFDQGPLVVAGDFNSNLQWDKAPHFHHASLIRELSARGLVSLHHSRSGEDHGRESVHTYHQWRNVDHPYHIDYIFLPQEWTRRIASFEIGKFAAWSLHNDHCPLTAEIRSLDNSDSAPTPIPIIAA